MGSWYIAEAGMSLSLGEQGGSGAPHTPELFSMATVCRYKLFDPCDGDWVVQLAKGTKERIERLDEK